MALVAYIG